MKIHEALLFRAALKVTTRESGGVEVRVCGTIASASRRKKGID